MCKYKLKIKDNKNEYNSSIVSLYYKYPIKILGFTFHKYLYLSEAIVRACNNQLKVQSKETLLVHLKYKFLTSKQNRREKVLKIRNYNRFIKSLKL